MESVMQNEHHGWGPKVFGGTHADHRDARRARADLVRYEAELARLSELVAFDRSLEPDAAYAFNLVAWTKQRLDALDSQRAEARRQAIYEAQEAETRARYGLPPKPRELTPDELRDEQHRLELAQRAAQPRVSDPYAGTAAERKARLKVEQDERDPFLQARLTGKSPLDAATVARAEGRPL